MMTWSELVCSALPRIETVSCESHDSTFGQRLLDCGQALATTDIKVDVYTALSLIALGFVMLEETRGEHGVKTRQQLLELCVRMSREG